MKSKVLQELTLIVATEHYPYGHSETFFENEIPFLADRFRKVILVPCAGAIGTGRAIPPNVEVALVGSVAAGYLKGFLHSLIEIEFYREFFRRFPGTLRRSWLLKLVAYLERALQIKKVFKEILKRESSDVALYSYWLTEAALAASLLRRERSLVAVSRAHRFDVYEKDNSEYLPYMNFVLRSLSKTFPVSDDGRATLQVSAPSVTTIRTASLGVPIPKSQAPTSGSDSFNVASCSSIIPRKRVGLLIEPLLQVARGNRGRIHWHHLGDGPGRKAVELSLVSGVPTNLSFSFYGQVANRDVHEFFRKNPVDLFVNLSESEGIPVSIMEAMSYGVPVLATDVGGTSELVDSEVGHLLSPEPTVQDIVIALDRAMSENWRESKGLTARARVQRDFDAAKNYPGFLAELEALIRQ